MSIKYEKWRELSIEPFDIEYNNIKLIDIVSYPPAQNDVIECTCKIDNEEKNAFIKIERSKMADFITENNNLNTLINKNYYKKVPKVIEFGKVNDKHYIILEKLDGARLSDIFKRSNVDKKEYLIRYGKELAIIHQIPNNEFCGAKQRIINDIPTKENYKDIDGFLTPYLIYLQENNIQKDDSTFIHGDFHYANVLWKQNDINGVLDWEYSGRGFKEQDIAWACILRPTQQFMDTLEDINYFLEGYSQLGHYNGDYIKWCLINGYIHFYLMNTQNVTYKEKIKQLIKEVNNTDFNKLIKNE